MTNLSFEIMGHTKKRQVLLVFEIEGQRGEFELPPEAALRMGKMLVDAAESYIEQHPNPVETN